MAVMQIIYETTHLCRIGNDVRHHRLPLVYIYTYRPRRRFESSPISPTALTPRDGVIVLFSTNNGGIDFRWQFFGGFRRNFGAVLVQKALKL